MDFILERLKAIVGFAAVPVTTAIFNAVEQGLGFAFPTDWKTWVIAFVVGILVHQTTNKIS